MAIQAEVRMLRSDNRLFRTFLELSIFTQSLAIAVEVLWGRNPKYDPGDYVSVICKHLPFAFRLPLHGPIECVLTGASVSEIGLTITTSPPPLAFAKQANFERTFNHLIAPFFTAFFEQHRPWVADQFPRYENWPSEFNFARVVRNAFAHGGRISLDSPTALGGEWRGLKYGHQQNGRKIIGVDLAFADLLLLMLDASDALDHLGCPLPT